MTEEIPARAAATSEIRLPVLGIETSFRTDDLEALEVVRTTYGHWAELPSSVVDPEGPVVTLVADAGLPSATAGRAEGGSLTAGSAPEAGRSRPVHRIADPQRLVVQGCGALGLSDAARGVATAWLAPGAVREPDFVDAVLEPLTLFLLGPRDRQPLHAAAVVRDGVALLLAGESGAGKSTVAYASRAAGFSTLADEPVYVQLRPKTRVWGRRSRLHLAVEAREHFPELRGVAPRPMPSGKTKIVSEGAPGGTLFAERMGLCVLRRTRRGPARLTWMSPAEAVERLTRRLDPGYDLYAASIGARIAAVAETGAWSLEWSGGPEAAVELLGRLAAELRRP